MLWQDARTSQEEIFGFTKQIESYKTPPASISQRTFTLLQFELESNPKTTHQHHSNKGGSLKVSQGSTL